MIEGKLNKNRCEKGKGKICSKECISEYGIYHCDSNACIYCDTECGMRQNAEEFARKLKERANHFANKIDKNNGLYDEFCWLYRTFVLTAEFLKLLEPQENLTSHSTNYKNYLRMYREGEDLRSIMDKLEKMEGTK